MYFFVNRKDIFFAKKEISHRKNVHCKAGIVSFVLTLVFLAGYPSLHAQYQDRRTLNENNAVSSRNTIPPQATYKKPLYILLKNNLLYDAVLLPNLTAEVYLGKQWSLAVEGNWSWWLFSQPKPNEWYHRIQTAGIEVRKWICSPFPFYGHAIGVYGMIGNYDVRAFTKDENSKGWLSYRSWSAGITYSYSIPISRRVNIELGVALGYVGGEYYEYNYCLIDDWWAQQAVHSRKYFGPTRAGVSLAWLIGRGNSTRQGLNY